MRFFLFRTIFINVLLTFLFFSCNPASKRPEVRKLINGHTTAILFLSSGCPMCQNYCLTLTELYSEYKAKGIVFCAVFSGKSAEDTAEVNTFIQRYKLNFFMMSDPGKKISEELQATVTPEVFLISSAGETLYKGSIDNWLIEPGQKRTVVTEHYLKDALKAYTSGLPIKIKSTTAKGCLIE